MQKVMEYKLVVGGSPQALEAAVNGEMRDGWVPSGTMVTFGQSLVQAMVKFEEA